MTATDEARARVREVAGDELAERLDHLDATRGRRPDDARAETPDLGATPDCDVALVGSGLSTLYAVTLAARGLKVFVFDRGRAATAHREWNASARELQRLVHAGVVDRETLDALVIARYDHGVCRWHGGGCYPVRDVLDHAIDAGALLAGARAKAEALGARFFDGEALIAHESSARAVCLRLRDVHGATREVLARVMVDARGASSPSATADLVCPTVGGVITGLAEGTAPDEVNPRVGDILVTTDDIEGGRQHIWEGFPGRAGETTVYLFYYDRAERVGAGSLMELYARFFDTLGRYKRGSWRLARPTFGYIPGWSRLGPAPRAPRGRVVLVGDAAARQSPLTYCGFGATLRSLSRASDAIARVADGASPPECVVDDGTIHAATGALAHMIASPPSSPRRAHELNALLDAAFGTLHEMGEAAFGALLRDELDAREVVRFLQRTSVKFPRVYPEVFRVLGARGVARWGAGIARGLVT